MKWALPIFFVLLNTLQWTSAADEKSVGAKIVGTWEGNTESGAEQWAAQFIFENDGSFLLHVPAYGETMLGRYKLDAAADPPKIDLQIQREGVTRSLFSILLVEGAESAMMAEPSGFDEGRPKDFNGKDVIMLQRVKEAALTEEEILTQLQGEWKAGDLTLEFLEDGTFSWETNGQSKAGTYKVDATKIPVQMDLLIGEGEEKSALLTLIQLYPGGVMKFAEPATERPANLEKAKFLERTTEE